jgi:hypothetical protein
VALAAVALLAAGGALARIVPQRGIDGLTLSMTKAQVRNELGPPARIKTGRNEFGPYAIWLYRRVEATFQSGNRATALQTTSRRERTASGVGVGSTAAQVRAGVGGVHCETTAAGGHCYVGSFTPGKRVTDFFLGANGRVIRVVVGFVID